MSPAAPERGAGANALFLSLVECCRVADISPWACPDLFARVMSHPVNAFGNSSPTDGVPQTPEVHTPFPHQTSPRHRRGLTVRLRRRHPQSEPDASAFFTNRKPL